MKKSFLPFLIVVVLVSVFGRVETSHAQSITLPAEINKKFTPIAILAGETSVLSVTIYNPNIFPLTDASWTDNLAGIQPGLQIASPVVVTNTCGGSVTAAAGSSSFSLSGGVVPAQSGTRPGSCTVSVQVTSFTSGSLINTIPVGALESQGGGTSISNTSSASATLNVTGNPTPSVSKSFSPGTIWADGTSRLTVTIRNNLPTTQLRDVSLTDQLPANVFLADPVLPVLNGCGDSASLAADSGGTSFTLSLASIAPSSSCTITVSVTSEEQGAYTNTIPAEALQTGQGLTNLSSASTRLNVQEIGLTKRFSPSTFPAGEATTLIITLQNPTASDYTDVRFTDNLPDPLIVAGTVTNNCGGTISTTEDSITLTGGTIPAGSPENVGTCEILVPVTVPAGTESVVLRNTIPAGGLTTAQNVSNANSASATVTVLGSQVLAIKSFSPTSIPVDGNTRLRIDLTAPGDTDLTNVSVTDRLPEGLTISNSTPASTSGCGPTPPLVLTAPTGEDTISLTNGFILAGQRCRIEVYVTGRAVGSFTNTIPPENISNTEGRRPANAISSTLNISGVGTLEIDLVKGFDPLIVTGGAISTLSIQIINHGTLPLAGIAFTDVMPDHMILANPANFDVGTCGGSLTGTPGSSSFSFSGGSLPALTSCTLTLSATMTVNGNLTNTIPAGAVSTTNGVTNLDPVQASLTNLPGASVSKSFSPNPIPAGSYSVLTIVIQNTGNIELVEMGMKDLLPAGLEIAGTKAPAPVNHCGGTLTAAPGTQLIELVNGTLAGNSNCTILVSITGNAAGEYQNTIPVGGLKAKPDTENTEPANATLKIIGGSEPIKKKEKTSKNTAAGSGYVIPVTGFQAGTVTQMDTLAPETYLSVGDVTLEIPSLAVKIPIVGVPKRGGTWNVSWLGEQAGWLEGSAFPSWNGNSVLTGHVYLSTGLPGPFVNLDRLKKGDTIIIYAYGQRYIFAVQTNIVVDASNRSMMAHEENPWLTLVTCKDYDAAAGTYLNRVLVRAALLRVDRQ